MDGAAVTGQIITLRFEARYAVDHTSFQSPTSLTPATIIISASLRDRRRPEGLEWGRL
jgi:hypothetical protein